MSGSREEERRKLADIINHWNANRLDLFEISQPTEHSFWSAENKTEVTDRQSRSATPKGQQTSSVSKICSFESENRADDFGWIC
uniref:Afadin n=1 Tax=Esox lucius TaxID=8010 RepID=C1BWA6_ESOLU|nr:Afadin [Esox lucius]